MSLRTDALQALLALAFGGIVSGCQFEGLRHQPIIPVIPPNANGPSEAPATVTTPPTPLSPAHTIASPVSRLKDATPVSAIKLASAEAPAVATEDKLRDLYRQAANQYAKIGSYIARFRRQEQVGSKERPEELVVFKFRKQPYSVSMKWIGNEGKGREVIYVKGQYEDKIHTLLAAGDVPLMPAGKQFAIPVDSPLVQANSRYPLTEAGIGSLIERFGQSVAKCEQLKPNARTCLVCKGCVKRPEYTSPVEEVDQTIAAGQEPLFPQGGSRQWFFDPVSHLPMLVIAFDSSHHQVEYYCYDQLMTPVGLDDEDFNPANLGKSNR